MDHELIDRLRADLASAEYRPFAVAGVLGEVADTARQRGVFAPALRVLAERGPSPVATLIRLFLLGEFVSSDELDDALPVLRHDGARRLGLVTSSHESSMFRAALSLNPVSIQLGTSSREWWILSDLDDQLRRGPARSDHVMGVGSATRSLIAQAPVQAADSVLDLGTGCGVVALHLASEVAASAEQRVVATDISERALNFARANARLNGLAERIEFRQGNLFEPVGGEQFSLILSNPPFVITPQPVQGDHAAGPKTKRYEYRDGGMSGDDLVARVVQEAPQYLAPGGTLLCLANWESPWGVDGLERVRQWLGGHHEDRERLAAWVIERDRVDPAQYAETWARDGGARPGTVEFEALMTEWLDDFAARRVVAIGLGSIRVRRLPGPSVVVPDPGDSLIHVERASGMISSDAGTVLQHAFDDAIRVAQMTDMQMLDTHWLLDSAVSEEREHRPGEEAPRAIVLATERGVARRVAADPLLAAALGACDGELSLRQIADALAALLDVNAAAAAQALVAGLRELVWMGMVSPAT